MKTWKSSILIAATLVAMSNASAAPAQQPSPTPNSAQSSPRSATDASVGPPDTRVGTRAPSPPAAGTPPNGTGTSLSASDSHGRAGSPRSDIIAACSAAVDELKASRTLIDALDAEIEQLRSRLEVEKRTTAILTELNETRRSESDALRKAIDAKSESLASRDAVIATQDKLIDALKTKKPSPWRRLGDILIGAAAIAVLK